MLLLLIMMMVIMELTPHSVVTALEELATQRPTPPRFERLASNERTANAGDASKTSCSYNKMTLLGYMWNSSLADGLRQATDWLTNSTNLLARSYRSRWGLVDFPRLEYSIKFFVSGKKQQMKRNSDMIFLICVVLSSLLVRSVRGSAGQFT